MNGIVWIIISVILGAIGQIVLKIGMLKISKLSSTSLINSVLYFIKAIFSPLIIIGLFSYGISMIIWLWVLSKYELSYAYPFAALAYIIVALFSFFIMGENVNIIRWIGIILIVIGVIFVAKS